MRVVGVKRAWGQPSSFFFKLRSTAHRCRPVELWATHCVVQAQRQIHRVFAGPLHRRWPENAFSDRDCRTTMTVSCRCVAIRGSSPFIDCGFDARRTSHPVAVPRTAGTTIPHSRGHRAREGGSTLYVGTSSWPKGCVMCPVSYILCGSLPRFTT